MCRNAIPANLFGGVEIVVGDAQGSSDRSVGSMFANPDTDRERFQAPVELKLAGFNFLSKLFSRHAACGQQQTGKENSKFLAS